MTEHELQLLAIGAGFGSNLTLLLWIVLDEISDRRAARRHSASTSTVADLPSRNVWIEPHPAEVLEASVRDFELTLHDGLDRTEDAARRDGLL